jgi:hypothetical protein
MAKVVKAIFFFFALQLFLEPKWQVRTSHDLASPLTHLIPTKHPPINWRIAIFGHCAAFLGQSSAQYAAPIFSPIAPGTPAEKGLALK